MAPRTRLHAAIPSLFLSALIAAAASSAPLARGDILGAGDDFSHIDGDTGAQRVYLLDVTTDVATDVGGNVFAEIGGTWTRYDATAESFSPAGFAVVGIDSQNRLYADPGDGNPVRIDPATGLPTATPPATLLLAPYDPVRDFTGSGQIARLGNDAVYLADPVSGDETVLSSGGLLEPGGLCELCQPQFLHVSAQGRLFVAVTEVFSSWSVHLVEVDVFTGDQTFLGTFSPGAILRGVHAMLSSPTDGDVLLFVQLDESNGIVRRDLATSQDTLFALTPSGMRVPAVFDDVPPGNGQPPAPIIRVLSNRADLISGGNALVEVIFDSGAAPASTQVRLDGVDVTAQFATRPNGRYMGVVTGLPEGPSELSVHFPGGGGSKIAITNHPIEGPVFSGPHLTPWACTLDGADAQCNAPPTVRYHYQSVATPGVFQPYDTESPPDPSSVRSITTDHGETVPYIVREEVGSMNRGIYSVAILFDPERPFEPWAPQEGWNGKLFYPFGASCGTNYNQGSEQSVLDDRALSQGFAVATSSLNELGHHCDTVKSAESAMMLKEHIIESFGEIRYTFGEGLSGGSIGQLQVANAYPGLLQGLIPGLTYPDVWTTAMDVADCYLLEEYYAGPGAALFAAPVQRMAVEGHGTPTVCPAWVALFGANIFPDTGCNAGSAPDYDAQSQPDGCRATVQDIQVNVWGRRPQDGFAHQPYSNEGVQYGLEALNAGEILPEQFLHLNENVGGADIDGNLVPQRNVMTSTVASTAYRAARIDDGGALDQVAIIDLPSPENAEIHTPYHAFSIEERLIKAHGQADNHAIWRGGTIDGVAPAFDTMDAWLEAVEADDSAQSLAQKIVGNRPASDPPNGIGAAEDSCFIGGVQVFDPTACDVAWPYFASTRIAAGQALAKDVIQCQLKTPDPADYTVPFTPEQWQRLLAAFPTGVCDWDAPAGDGQEPSRQWVSYAGGPGGEPLGPAPVSVPLPEPGALAMLGAGALLLRALRRRRATA